MKLVGLLLVAYAALVAGCTVIQRSMMYFPDRTLGPPADYGAPAMRVVRLATRDGLELTSWYQPAREGFATIVYFQGNGGNIGNRIYKTRQLMAAGYGLLLVGYRGYGGNDGKPTEDGLYDDGRAALAFLAEQGIPPERTVLLGESLGTGVAVRMAAEHDVAAVMLEAPYTSTADVGQAAFFFLPVKLLIYDRFEAVEQIARIEAPLLVVHGERDSTIPVRFGRRLFEAAVEPKEGRFLPNADHNDLFHHGLVEIELDFLARHLKR
ncbi:MAG: alpha/beta hydrolase [Alphaproteobacteria bacterium]|nr:alpha/beta hydrolase [Alphaproteobacteria bacterium]MDP6815975.1 alpha/beta hydrolase [Alphaproteobacteria bacterium]